MPSAHWFYPTGVSLQLPGTSTELGNPTESRSLIWVTSDGNLDVKPTLYQNDFQKGTSATDLYGSVCIESRDHPNLESPWWWS